MTVWRLALLGALCVVATGCATVSRQDAISEGTGARAPAAPVPPSRIDRAPAPPSSGAQTGKASWYGDAHHGKKTASGETYDMNALTAAHRTLPIGTRVRVTNVDNERSVVVRVNDRGPFVDGRVIDLSRAAARALGVLGAGVFTVRLEILEDAAAEPPPSR